LPNGAVREATVRRVSMATRDELLEALMARYQCAERAEKGRILSEFASVTGYHRKHAARMLRATSRPDSARPRPERRVHDDAVREALIVARGRRRTASAGRAAEGTDPGSAGGDGEARASGAGPACPSAARDDRRGHHRPHAGQGRAKAAADADAWRGRRRSDARSGSGPTPTGTIRRRASWRPTWWRMAVRSRTAASFRRWSSPTSRPAGPNARRCSTADSTC
jgi:hypothetical protein